MIIKQKDFDGHCNSKYMHQVATGNEPVWTTRAQKELISPRLCNMHILLDIINSNWYQVNVFFIPVEYDYAIFAHISHSISDIQISRWLYIFRYMFQYYMFQFFDTNILTQIFLLMESVSVSNSTRLLRQFYITLNDVINCWLCSLWHFWHFVMDKWH